MLVQSQLHAVVASVVTPTLSLSHLQKQTMEGLGQAYPLVIFIFLLSAKQELILANFLHKKNARVLIWCWAVPARLAACC